MKNGTFGFRKTGFPVVTHKQFSIREKFLPKMKTNSFIKKNLCFVLLVGFPSSSFFFLLALLADIFWKKSWLKTHNLFWMTLALLATRQAWKSLWLNSTKHSLSLLNCHLKMTCLFVLTCERGMLSSVQLGGSGKNLTTSAPSQSDWQDICNVRTRLVTPCTWMSGSSK